jgi:hypothetical protein
MAMVGPWLNDYAVKKRKLKYASAEAKRLDIELKKEWNEKLNSFKLLSKPSTKKIVKALPKLGPPPGRETPVYSSHPITMGVAAKKPKKVYTGNKIIGVSVVHKSCLQPVFNESEAKDFASMRR